MRHQIKALSKHILFWRYMPCSLNRQQMKKINRYNWNDIQIKPILVFNFSFN